MSTTKVRAVVDYFALPNGKRLQAAACRLPDSSCNLLENLIGQHLRYLPSRYQMNLRVFGSFVRLVNSSKIFDLACESPAVQSLGIAGNADVERRVDEDLDKFAGIEQFAHALALGAERRDQGAEHDQARLGHQL